MTAALAEVEPQTERRARILVVDDNEEVREYLRLQLEAGGFEVELAENGVKALESISVSPPDLLLTDLSMPEMDGFQLIEAVRFDPVNTSIPIILLTAHNDVAIFRRGMDLGADDFLTKPVKSKELLNALNSRLKRLEGMRVARTGAVPRTFEVVRATADAARRAPSVEVTQSQSIPLKLHSAFDDTDEFSEAKVSPRATKKTVDGTVLIADIRGFAEIAERLTTDEVTELLNAFFAKACEPILDQGGWIVKFMGDGVVAMFDSTTTQNANHAARAMKSAILMVMISQRFQHWMETRFPQRNLPAFCVGLGLHSGPVTVCQIGSGATQEVTVVGDTVGIAARLESKTKELTWSIVASAATARAASSRYQTAQSAEITLRSSAGQTQTLDIVEVTGLTPPDNCEAADREVYKRIGDAIRENASLIEMRRENRAATTASNGSTQALATKDLQLDGYRLLRKLGQGGMSTVYLAEFSRDGTEQVLKMISLEQNDDGEAIQRFISEFALISQIQHPNVARIYAQGFSGAHAYISMEYFPSGDLRRLIDDGMSADLAVATLMQVAAGLSAIHEVGIVHRDMKPDNVMIRADGSLALADFGIAMHTETKLNQTEKGIVFGTPSYIAPEQVQGEDVDARADIYSLGVMFFEMLTGRKPFRATNPQALIFQHLSMPVPDLPPELARFNPLIHKMMAKSANDRHANALQVIDDVMAVVEAA